MASEFLLGDEKRPLLVLKGFRKAQQFKHFPLKKKTNFKKNVYKKWSEWDKIVLT